MSQHPSSQNQYNTITIRELLEAAFNDEEFGIFCYDHFPIVYKKFSTGMTFPHKVQLLVEHCGQTNSFSELLQLVKIGNPEKYAEFASSVQKETKVTELQYTSQSQTYSSEPSLSTKIFISYAREQTDLARRLAQDLQKAGFVVWWDLSNLKGGEAWDRTIQAALKASQFCLVLLTLDAVESKWVRKEYMYAVNLGLGIIPLLHQECEIPMALIDMQYVDFRKNSYKQGLKELLGALPHPKKVEISETLKKLDYDKETQPHQNAELAPKQFEDGQLSQKASSLFVAKLLVFARDPVWQMIGVIIAIAALGWAVYAFYVNKNIFNDSSTSTPTAKAIALVPTATHISNLTSTPTRIDTLLPTEPPNIAATETTIANMVANGVFATRTAEAKEWTPTPMPVPTSVPTMVSMSEVVLVKRDDFSSRETNWDEYTDKYGSSTGYENGKYFINLNRDVIFLSVWGGGGEVEDGVLQVEILGPFGVGGARVQGLSFGWQNEDKNEYHYAFTVDALGQCQFLQGNNFVWIIQKKGTTINFNKELTPHTLTVIIRDSEVTGYVDSIFCIQYELANYKSGLVGVVANSVPKEKGKSFFDNYQIFRFP